MHITSLESSLLKAFITSNDIPRYIISNDDYVVYFFIKTIRVLSIKHLEISSIEIDTTTDCIGKNFIECDKFAYIKYFEKYVELHIYDVSTKIDNSIRIYELSLEKLYPSDRVTNSIIAENKMFIRSIAHIIVCDFDCNIINILKNFNVRSLFEYDYEKLYYHKNDIYVIGYRHGNIKKQNIYSGKIDLVYTSIISIYCTFNNKILYKSENKFIIYDFINDKTYCVDTEVDEYTSITQFIDDETLITSYLGNIVLINFINENIRKIDIRMCDIYYTLFGWNISIRSRVDPETNIFLYENGEIKKVQFDIIQKGIISMISKNMFTVYSANSIELFEFKK
jgi:hypothetical protein